MGVDISRTIAEAMSNLMPPGVIGAINTLYILYKASNGTGIVKDSDAVRLALQSGFTRTMWFYYMKKLRNMGVVDKRWDNYVIPEKVLRHFKTFLEVLETGDYCKARDKIKELWNEADNAFSVALVVYAVNYLMLMDIIRTDIAEGKQPEKVILYAREYLFR